MLAIDSFKTEVNSRINDIQCDFYGVKIAVALSNGQVAIFKENLGQMEKVSEINAHDGPVLKVEWSHPRFCSLLATCGFDKKVILWRPMNTSFEKVFEYSEHTNAITSFSFSHHESDLFFACGSLDGSISVHQYKNNDSFTSEKFQAHDFGVNEISFSQSLMQFVSCGNDNFIKVWSTGNNGGTWKMDASLECNDELSKDVAFRPKDPKNSFTSTGDDGIVSYWEYKGNQWERRDLYASNLPLIKLSWNDNGTVLIAISADGTQHVINEEQINQSQTKTE